MIMTGSIETGDNKNAVIWLLICGFSVTSFAVFTLKSGKKSFKIIKE